MLILVTTRLFGRDDGLLFLVFLAVKRFEVMSFTLEDIASLRAGHRDPIVVGDLPHAVAEYMGVYVPKVYLSQESLAHINYRHPDVLDVDILLAQNAIRNGWFLRENKKPEKYLCSYFDQHSSRRFGGVLKIASPDREVYLTTFHRAHRRQTIAWQKRCTTVRTHC